MKLRIDWYKKLIFDQKSTYNSCKLSRRYGNHYETLRIRNGTLRMLRNHYVSYVSYVRYVRYRFVIAILRKTRVTALTLRKLLTLRRVETGLNNPR